VQNNNYNNYRYKACTPQKTIHRIREILNKIDVFIIENQWFDVPGKKLNSVQIALYDNFKVITNGKGVDRKYALASGLAEFVERIQNRQFTRVIHSCLGVEYYYYPDTIEMNTHDIKLLDYLAPKGSTERENIHRYEKNGKMKVVPFYNVFNNRLDYIPDILLHLKCGSNGMCAGNTPHEAIIQGICENFEREILYKIYFEGQSFPTIPDAFLKQTPGWLHINNFKEMGFEIEVKDCTLDGLFPVVGVIFMKENKVNFCAGSAPDFNVALERCFTEIFQGKNPDTISKYLYEKNKITKENSTLHYLEALKSHSGALPGNLFVNQGIFKEKNLFWSKDLIGLVPLKGLIEKIGKMGLQLLVRDVSFLGFPSYFVYIPGMSEKIIQPSVYNKSGVHLYSIKNTLFNLKKADKKSISFLAEFLEKRYYHAKKNNIEFHLLKTLEIPYKENSPLNLMAVEIFLAVLFGRIGNYDKAIRLLKMFLKTTPKKKKNVNNALNCFVNILKMLKEGKNLKDINQLIEKKYSSNVICENIFLLEPCTDIGKVFSIPKQSQDCVGCDVCYYKEFKDLAQKIEFCMQKYHFNQMLLKSVFEEPVSN
jgi:ribosomal protein S12 methylthiotransferase accessory factor